MATPANMFGFAADVCTAGYKWFTAKELQLKCEKGYELPGPYLIENRPFGAYSERIVRYPSDNMVLFREFAELDVNDLSAIAAFASTNGPLGFSDDDDMVDWSASPAGEKQIEWVSGADIQDRNHPQQSITDRSFFVKDRRSTIEHHKDWVECIARIRSAVTVYDLVRIRDEVKLRDLFKWRRFDRDGAGFITECWYIDTHRTLPETTRPPERVFCSVGCEEELCTPHAPIMSVALTYLAETVTSWLQSRVSPALEYVDGELIEYLRCESLWTLLWSQLFTAISEGREQRKCPSCGDWFDIGGRDGATTRKVFCSDRCRVRAAESRKGRVIELAETGETPEAIVTQLRSEGHETELATVRKWIKAAKKGGK